MWNKGTPDTKIRHVLSLLQHLGESVSQAKHDGAKKIRLCPVPSKGYPQEKTPGVTRSSNNTRRGSICNCCR